MTKTALRDDPEELIQSGDRGKYAKADGEGMNIVLIDVNLHKQIPDSETVNRASREYVASKRTAA
jgi:hypothetical protein